MAIGRTQVLVTRRKGVLVCRLLVAKGHLELLPGGWLGAVPHEPPHMSAGFLTPTGGNTLSGKVLQSSITSSPKWLPSPLSQSAGQRQVTGPSRIHGGGGGIAHGYEC